MRTFGGARPKPAATTENVTVADLAIIGGSGFYSFLDDVREVEVATPFGAPSAPVAVGTLDGCAVAFLPRHGAQHQFPPHRVNFRANIWALHSLGVTRVVAPCAVGSLRRTVRPGDVVVCDQFVDRTWGRPDTFFDGPAVNHVSVADPYCSELRDAAIDALVAGGVAHHPTGTVVVVQGPRFSTRAESAWYRAAGWSVVNMTQCPEASLAREAGLCYAALGLVTDYDAGVDDYPDIRPVEMADVFEMLRRTVDQTRAVLRTMIPTVPSSRGCGCPSPAPTGSLGA